MQKFQKKEIIQAPHHIDRNEKEGKTFPGMERTQNARNAWKDRSRFKSGTKGALFFRM